MQVSTEYKYFILIIYILIISTCIHLTTSNLASNCLKREKKELMNDFYIQNVLCRYEKDFEKSFENGKNTPICWPCDLRVEALESLKRAEK